ncbi:Putative 2-C-methyl-D-erythritol 4-phosphate cytidylyltransferase 2 [Gemella morbillorum]|uniref:Ribitol-5-phosphate cytidylyltransferase n=1 Tax=Gemella morbillorum TaxID=29391 RepID=A0A2X4RCG3_9BACL|nr:2-C-methyl-D-erythritol 4-phosphate cytidylyltransferase [Gemella morbillorum]EFV35032.1 2-C-methyl-D-erythritol 4-phosphate cytidylyltransferase [Gemella morbillorum M424]MDK8238996.1 2-C-methyl-D-erythritol 4-phosphate cytidylyltransferase [Gemella morbillorum]MDK8254454.1 2-C-methyl-D-erythritol 4-phosphate cytidylyltransferase [Gemella morbillorum]QGS09028.1 D-ribitol-5-phosphate cytidylyltransferase [Gemella morbillorum]UBH80918.1 2-C-methyl-D-erythritol 4-phosphate cytidylyltransferas
MIYAGILAGGTGTRMGISNMPKQFLDLGNKPIIIHTIEKFLLEPEIEKIVVGVHEDWISHAEDLVEEYISTFKDRIIIVAGGSDRNTTIENIIKAIDDYKELTDEDIVITHDSVRPFITLRIIKDNIRLAKECDAVDTVVEAVDTIVESTNGEYITNIPNRAHYYQGQTPQSFRCKDFLNLYNSLTSEEKQILTDACKIFVIKGKEVALAKGEYSNLKITTVTDLKIAKSMLEDE